MTSQRQWDWRHNALLKGFQWLSVLSSGVQDHSWLCHKQSAFQLASFGYLYCSSWILCYFMPLAVWMSVFAYCYITLTSSLAVTSSADYDSFLLMSVHLPPCLSCLWTSPPWLVVVSSTAPRSLLMGLRTAAISLRACCLSSELANTNQWTDWRMVGIKGSMNFGSQTSYSNDALKAKWKSTMFTGISFYHCPSFPLL